jgi:hypothetical protein
MGCGVFLSITKPIANKHRTPGPKFCVHPVHALSPWAVARGTERGTPHAAWAGRGASWLGTGEARG